MNPPNDSLPTPWPDDAIQEVAILMNMGMSFFNAKNEISQKYRLDLNYYIADEVGSWRALWHSNQQ